MTKWLYPEVAAHYNTNWKRVERSLRTVVAIAWRSNPTLLCLLAGEPLIEKPRLTHFISILSRSLSPKDIA